MNPSVGRVRPKTIRAGALDGTHPRHGNEETVVGVTVLRLTLAYEALNLLASWSSTPSRSSVPEAADETVTATKETPVEIAPNQPSVKGPADWFTGDVWIDPVAQGQKPSQWALNAVHFTPGARTAWHCHSGGQTLAVTDGRGLVQSRGGDIITIRPGDVVRTPADEWHWHGAAPDHFMTHLSITEGDAEWGAHVTDTEYAGDQ